MWNIEHIVVVKSGDTSGEASVKLTDEEGTALFLNKINIDLSSGANAIGIAKVNGTPVISGAAIDDIKAMILDAFQHDLCDSDPGIYRINDNGVESI
jgi:hypothetical protein